MFVELANLTAPGAPGADIILTQNRPLQILDLLENYWQTSAPAWGVGAQAGHARGAPLGVPLGAPLDVPGIAPPNLAFPLHHIAYAFCLENTRLAEIMRRVVFEYRHGERLPPALAATQQWLHTTEEVFLGTAPYSVRSLTSSVRPDPAAVRRNAYYRLLGMDLNHGSDDGRPYAYLKAEASNREFATVFEALLRETWKGYTNRFNWLNENTTDNNAITELVRRLHEMLNARRINGNLVREEFDAIATMSWYYLTVAYNTQIVFNLNAPAAGVADRLRKIGERVGLAPHARADSYFQLAEPMSVVLRAIEQPLPLPGGAATLYNGLYQPQMLQIMTHWSIATGRDIKAPDRAAGAVLAGTAPGARSGNGQGSRIAAMVR